ncbi:polysaccharide deacetylase family protein [Lutimaribacter marinistellae]|uniref:Chitooligosaccharide deacetylase n=1 Tax=Lutimaribacter marinistellae TaxID=1820329 RepID=A0ABV7T9M3_9RHOB
MQSDSAHSYASIIFHGVGKPDRVLEDGEAQYWLSRDKFCRILDRIVGMGKDAPQITFDDGNASDFEIALPELKQRGLTAVFFVLTARLGERGSLTEADVQELSGAGHIIGSHGHRHRDWRRLDAAGRIEEFETARTRLSALAGTEITDAAAPFGLYDREVAGELRQRGYRAIHTSDWGRATRSRFIRPRNCLDDTMTHEQIERALTGRISLARHPRRWLGLARKRLLPARKPA